MNLAIDIGNSFTHFAVYNGRKKIKSFRIPTHSKISKQPFHKKYLSVYINDIEDIGISSVVPAKDRFWREYTIKYFKQKPLFINNKTSLPFNFKINKVSSPGADRICNSVFGYEYFNRKENVIVIDFGTANTYDVVLKNGYFAGGIIAPGIETSAKALNLNTGKLPLIKYNDYSFKRSVVGKNTFEAIQSGIMNYALFATEGIDKAIEREFGRKFKVIITGGLAKTIRKKLSIKTTYIENTVLEGINIILNCNKHK